MKHYLFLDESGDHGLVKIDPSFPFFVLCGIIIDEVNYLTFKNNFDNIKLKYWRTTNVIFHSRNIRKCDEAFSNLLDLEIKRQFYDDWNSLITQTPFTVIASCINKIQFVKNYGRILAEDVYEVALSFILERVVFYLDSLGNDGQRKVLTAIERRGKREDSKLTDHLAQILRIGTYFVDSQRFKSANFRFYFKDKRENILGLQLSDMVAYPIARKCLNTNQPNPAYNLIAPKFYSENGKTYGFKKFP